MIAHVIGIRNEVDVIAVYGGSILMKPYLASKLKALCTEREIKLLYAPEKNTNGQLAVIMLMTATAAPRLAGRIF